MKTLFSTLFILTLCLGNAFAQGEPVYSLTKQRQTNAWYQQQADAWKAFLDTNPTDGDAWLNYYTAKRMLKIQAQEVTEEELTAVVSAMEAAIPNTFEYYYIKQWNDGYRNYEKRQEWLAKAYALEPNRWELYDDLLTEHIVAGNQAKASEIATKWFESGVVSPGLLDWNYNALQSCDENAILITVGDNDTYPAWILQLHHGVRTDVKVMNASLLIMDNYRETMFLQLGIPQMTQTLDDVKDYHKYTRMTWEHIRKHLPNRPFYIATSASKKIVEGLEDDLYNVGMAQRWTEEEFDNIAVIKRNFEKRYRLDYLTLPMTPDISQGVVNHMNTNYLIGLFTLHQHYHSSEDQQEAWVESLIRAIGNNADMGGEIDEMIQKNKQG